MSNLQNKSNKLKLALIQQTCGLDVSENLDKTIDFVTQAAERGAKLVLLQELHKSLYFCQKEDPSFFDLAEPIPGATSNKLSALAKDLQIVLVSSLFEKRAPGLYHNTVVVFETDGSVAGKYRKMHIPDDPSYYEKFYFTPGDCLSNASGQKDAGFEPIETSVGKLGILICWDQWYPEAARIMALKGADLLIYPTAIGWHPADSELEKKRQLNSWETIQRSHAIANGLHVVSINRVGKEISDSSEIDFWGNSFIADPQGDLLKKASNDQEEILIQEIDFARTEEVRRMWPFLRDRRIDAYGQILRRFCD